MGHPFTCTRNQKAGVLLPSIELHETAAVPFHSYCTTLSPSLEIHAHEKRLPCSFEAAIAKVKCSVKNHTRYFSHSIAYVKLKIRENCHESQMWFPYLSILIVRELAKHKIYLSVYEWELHRFSTIFLCENMQSNKPSTVQGTGTGNNCHHDISRWHHLFTLRSYFICIRQAIDRLFICTKIVGAEMPMISSTGERKMKFF